MEKITIEKFIERVRGLPLDVRMGVTNVDYLTAIRNIQKENQLHIDQGASLEDLTFRMILGDIDESEYLGHLQNDLGVSQEVSYKLANSVNETILEPIREEIQKIQQEDALIDSFVTKQSETENHDDLTPEGILAGIEDPHPSKGIEHATVIPSGPVVTKSTPSTTPKVVTPAAAVTPVTPVSSQVPNMMPASPVLPQTSPVPTVKITEVLNQKLEQPVVTKPIQIAHSIDPYKEPIE